MEVFIFMKKKFLFLLAFVNIIYSAQRVEWLKGTYEPFQHESLSHCKGCSPLSGASLWHSGWISGLFNYGDSSHMVVQLVKALFHNQAGHICPSKSLHNPPYRMHKALLLPEFISLLGSNALTFDARESFLRRTVSGYAAYVCEHERVKDKKKIAKKVRRLQNQVNRFLDIAQQSVKEEAEGIYPVHTVEQVLSAYWVALLDHGTAGVDVPRYMDRFVPRYEHGDCYDPEELQATQKLIKSGSAEAISVLLGDIEKTSVARLAEIIHPDGFPSMAIYDYYNFADFEEKVPNCVETTFYNLFNFLLFDPSLKSYDLSRIPSMHERVRSFYINENSDGSSRLLATNTKKTETKRAWMSAVSNIKGSGIAYKMYDQYGMISNLDNFVRICRVLFDVHITCLEELGAVLSNSSRGIIVTVKRIDDSHYTIYLHDDQYDRIGQARILSLYVRDWHSWVEPLTIKEEPRQEFAHLLDDTFEHRQLKLFVDNPLPLGHTLPLLEYIMYSKQLDNEDLLTHYILAMIDIIKKERSFSEKASVLLRWMFKLSPEEEPPINNSKIRTALVGITDEGTLKKFLDYFDSKKWDLLTSDDEAQCARNFVIDS